MKVLIVDDNSDDLVYLSKCVKLSVSPVTVQTCDNYADAVQAISSNKFDCIIVDYLLGEGKTAKDLILEIKSRSKSTPVIAISEVMNTKFSEQTTNAGSLDFYLKDTINPESMPLYLKNALHKGKIFNSLLEAIHLNQEYTTHLSHDLRSPITSVIEFLEAGLSGNHEKLQKFARKALFMAKKSLRLSEDILAIYKTNISSSSDFDFPTSVEEYLKDDFMKVGVTMCDAKGIRFSMEMSDDLHVEFDLVSLKVILMNLLSNAVKFTPEEGSISVKVLDLPQSVRFEIQDSGVGISEELKDNIFNKEILTSDEGLRGEKGLGVGLPIVSELLVKLGSKLEFKSNDPIGTKFYFDISKSEARQLGS